MKHYDNIEKDAAFLRANIETNEERIRLPESLSEENIVELVSGKKQETASKCARFRTGCCMKSPISALRSRAAS